MQQQVVLTETEEKIYDFLDKCYRAELAHKVTLNKDHLVIDYLTLAKEDASLAELFLERPEDFLRFAERAVRFHADGDVRRFTIRVKNVSNAARVQISLIRNNHIGKVVLVDCMVKIKSDVRPQITQAKYECPGCGVVMDAFISNTVSPPTRCSCGRKGNFKQVSTELTDAFSMVVEEPSEMAKGGVRLSRIKVLCKDDLSNPEVEGRVFQGCRVELCGILKQAPSVKNKLSADLDIFIEANYIRVINDTYNDVEVSERDLVLIREIAACPDRMRILSEHIYSTIHGYDKEKCGLILSLFGGSGGVRNNKNVRGDSHCLLVGSTGSAKSDLLALSKKFCVKAMFESGKGVSGVGITASVVKDELLGGWSLEAGVLPLCNNGYAFIDELDKVADEDKQALHEALEQQSVTISKANIHATLLAKTTVIAAANPKYGVYTNLETVYKQIMLPPTLINRFDLIFIFEKLVGEENNQHIAEKILDRFSSSPECSKKYDDSIIVKYIAFAKRLKPTLGDDIKGEIAKWYGWVMMKSEESDRSLGHNAFPISPRILEGVIRLAQAHAKARLSSKIELEDFEFAKALKNYELSKIAFEPETGRVDVSIIESGVSRNQASIAQGVIDFMKGKDKADETEIFKYCEIKYSVNETYFRRVLSLLLKNGDLYEPNRGWYKLVT